MYSVTKWMLVAALIGVNGDAIARAQANDLDSVADLRTNGITSPEGAFQERDGRFLHEEGLSGTPGSIGYKKNVRAFRPGTFACGEVVGGYTVSCTTTPPTKTTVSAPEIDTSVAVGGAMFMVGCLAILHGRKRRLADGPVGGGPTRAQQMRAGTKRD